MIIYFQTIQTDFFHKKFSYEMFRSNFNMFLDLQGSCVRNKDESQEKTDYCIIVASLAMESFKDFSQRYFLGIFLQRKSLEDSDAKTRFFSLRYYMFWCGNPWRSRNLLKLHVNIQIYIPQSFT